MKPRLIASELLLDAVQRHNIHLSLLVADTGLWVNPEFHRRLLRDTGSVALFPKVRRARIGQGEQRGQIIDGVRLDDNNYANVAVKRAAGLVKSLEGFEACHIWPLTCYDERYHTAAANIVLLPRALAGLSDHDIEIQRALQYRAFELYGWWPDEMPEPVKPSFYPSQWRDPQPYEGEGRTPPPPKSPRSPQVLEDRIENWSRKPRLNVHKIIALVAQTPSGLNRDELVRRVAETTSAKDPYGAVASLLTDSGNAYGRVFANYDGIIRLNPEVEDKVRSFEWRIG